MLDPHDKVVLEETVERIVNARVDRVENKIDKLISMFIDLRDQHGITKARVDKHDKRLNKIEKKVGIKPSTSTTVFA